MVIRAIGRGVKQGPNHTSNKKENLCKGKGGYSEVFSSPGDMTMSSRPLRFGVKKEITFFLNEVKTHSRRPIAILVFDSWEKVKNGQKRI